MTDILQSVLDLLQDNWDSSNTDNKTPNDFNMVFDKKIVLGQDQDGIYVYSLPENQRPAGIGRSYKRKDQIISIDIRSTVSRSHAWKVKEEVLRILDNNLFSIGDDHEPIRTQDFCNRSIKLFRFVTDLKINWHCLSR